MRKINMKTGNLWILVFLLSLAIFLSGCSLETIDRTNVLVEEAVSGEADKENPESGNTSEESQMSMAASEQPFSAADMAPYTGAAYEEVNGNKPYFTEADLTSQSYEFYSDLDGLGRCGAAYASIGIDLMPTEKRGDIGQIKPSGWHTVKYDVVDGKYLYNRCHLIGFQLSGENANEKNLITGTRYMNVEGMLPFENMVADYVKETKNHVLYRVTPIFEGDNLVASGVLMEAESVEDKGEGILFCVYVYNVQPDVKIDYATGESSLQVQEAATQPQTKTSQAAVPQSTTYILNTNTKKFHYASCNSVKQMKESNKEVFTGSREEVISKGYEPCKDCNP